MNCATDELGLLQHSLSVGPVKASDSSGLHSRVPDVFSGGEYPMLLVYSSLISLVFLLLMVSLAATWNRNLQDLSASPKNRSLGGLSLPNFALGMLGIVMEMYDFGLYGVYAAELGDAFFFRSDRVGTISLTYVTYGSAYLMRPLGGILAGYIGDCYGRTTVVKSCLAAMVGATSVIGLLPPKGSIGTAAPIIIFIVRLIQGLAAGGVPTSFVYVLENAQPSRRCLISCLFGSSMTIGLLLSSAVCTASHSILSESSLHWRIPFLSAAALGAVGFWAAREATESDEYKVARDAGYVQQRPLSEAFLVNSNAMLQIIGASSFSVVAMQSLFVWMPTYQSQLRPPPALPYAFTINTAGYGVLLVMLLLWGWLADMANYEALMLSASAILSIMAFPCSSLFDSTEPKSIFATYVLFVIPFSAWHAVSFRWMFDRVPDVSLRCVTISIANGVAVALFAGPTTFIETQLAQTSWGVTAPGLYLAAVCFCSFLTIASTALACLLFPRPSAEATFSDSLPAGRQFLERW
mmetsp:Transcript_145988/g.254757  ORF Transcript_145988/g.254757 Transcript_145988/m.254757 type:complete len:522 (-) Transcript_145988:321-1886(-)